MLSHSFTIYVPSTTNGNVPALATQQKVATNVFAEMCDLFGGVTQSQVIGGYRLSDGTIVRESIITLRSFCDISAKEQHFAAVMAIAERVCKEMTQECVSVEVDGTLHFVEANAVKIAA